MDAWLRIRETAQDFGEQRVYASHKSIMFARKHCYFFVRPKPKFLEVVFFLGRHEKRPPVKQVYPTSRVKTGHLVQVRHRDEVEAPLTDWLRDHVRKVDGEMARYLRAFETSSEGPAKAKKPVA